jgi:hypothetical protein
MSLWHISNYGNMTYSIQIDHGNPFPNIMLILLLDGRRKISHHLISL